MIIGIESSSTDLSIAVGDTKGEHITVDGWSGGQRHARELLPRLVALLEQRDERLAEAAAVVVGIGPGSFTGLRVGMSLAKAIALAADCPIVGLSSLEAWLRAEPDASAAIGRAGVSEAYLLARGDATPSLVAFAALGEAELARVVAPTELIGHLALTDAVPPFGAAEALVRDGVRRLAQGGGDELETLEPAYLRLPRGLSSEPRGSVRCA